MSLKQIGEMYKKSTKFKTMLEVNWVNHYSKRHEFGNISL